MISIHETSNSLHNNSIASFRILVLRIINIIHYVIRINFPFNTSLQNIIHLMHIIIVSINTRGLHYQFVYLF